MFILLPLNILSDADKQLAAILPSSHSHYAFDGYHGHFPRHTQPEDELELHWSVDLAMRLLKDKDICMQGAKGGTSSSWCKWLAQLPTHVLTPLQFTGELTRQVASANVAQELPSKTECKFKSVLTPIDK